MTAGTSGDVSNLDIEAVGLSLRPMQELFESKMGFKALKKKMD